MSRKHKGGRVSRAVAAVTIAVATMTGVVLSPAQAAPAAGVDPIVQMLTGFSSMLQQAAPAPGGGGLAHTPQPAVPSPNLQGGVSGKLPATIPGVGQPINVLGAQGMVCRKLNAYGTKVLVAGPETSCEFAATVFATAMTGADPAKNIHFSSPRTMTVRSSVTGANYRIECTETDGEFFSCRDLQGGTAQVWAW